MSEKAPRFITRERVAEGRTVTVSNALDSETGREVALKTLREDHSTFDDRVAAFSAGSKLAARLFSAHLVPVIAARRVGSKIFTVSPWVGGIRLTDLPQPMAPELVAAILAQVAEGMNTAHAAGVLLRGLAPRDFRIRADGTVILLDLNKVQVPGPGNALPPTGPGRAEVLRYLPMEARSNGSVDVRTDVFCIGAFALELLTGVPPTREGAVDMKPALIQALTGAGALGKLAKLTMTLASPRPEQRPENVVNLADQLKDLWSSRGATPRAVVADAASRLAPAAPRATPVMVPAVTLPPPAGGGARSAPPGPLATPPVMHAVHVAPAATSEDDELMALLDGGAAPTELMDVKHLVDKANADKALAEKAQATAVASAHAASEAQSAQAAGAADPWGVRSPGRFRSLEKEVSSEGDQSGFAYMNDSGRAVVGQPPPNLERTRTQARGMPAVKPVTQPPGTTAPAPPVRTAAPSPTRSTPPNAPGPPPKR